MGYHYSNWAAEKLDWRATPNASKKHLKTLLSVAIEKRAGETVAELVVESFQHWDPNDYRNHPAKSVLDEAVKYLKQCGYRVTVRNHSEKNYGRQLDVILPLGDKYHHSSYRNDWPIIANNGVVPEPVMKKEEKGQELSDEEYVKACVIAQNAYSKSIGAPCFIPSEGICWGHDCGKQIFGKKLPQISLERAGSELITGCPHCFRTYCD